MANKNPLRGLPSVRKASQLEKARRKAQEQTRAKAERRAGHGTTTVKPSTDS